MAKRSQPVRLQRVLRAPPERVYKAFLDPVAIAKWIAPYGFTCTVHSLEAKEGGKYRMSFTNFGTGKGQSFHGHYKKLKPNELIEYNDQFDDPNLPGITEIKVSLRKVLCGTELTLEQSGIPDAIPLEFCYLGWQESLMQLANLVEPEIPDGA